MVDARGDGMRQSQQDGSPVGAGGRGLNGGVRQRSRCAADALWSILREWNLCSKSLRSQTAARY